MLDMVKKKQTFSAEILRRFSFFASFSAYQLEEIAETAERISLKTKQVVFRQGERSEIMYLILEGCVKIEREDDAGDLYVVGELGKNEIFGELAMLSKEPRQAMVTTTTHSELLAIDRAMMLDIIRKSNPEEILDIFSALSDNARAANDREFHELLSRHTMATRLELEKQRALTQMVAGVAHEINTPLGVINTAVSIMARELASVSGEMTPQRAADIAESLELMRRNVERADRLVQDFKKVSVSQLSDEKEKHDIQVVVEETVSLIKVSLKRNQIQVKLHNKLAAGQKQWIGYRGLLSQVLINLLSNVERYAYPNGVGGVVDVTLRLGEDANTYSLSIRDYGLGISKEDQARIFEPFFTTGRTIGGTGLGLSIVHNIVINALKGEIELKSTEGKGAEFIITFPRVVS